MSDSDLIEFSARDALEIPAIRCDLFGVDANPSNDRQESG